MGRIMKFEEILPALMDGKLVKCHDTIIQYVKEDEEIWIVDGCNKDKPLYCSFSDFILATDWEIR